MAAWALGLQALVEMVYFGTWLAGWDFLRYAWLPVLLAAWFWERVFRSWPERGLFHWLSLWLQGQVWAGLLLVFATLVLALTQGGGQEQAFLEAFQFLALRMFLLASYLSWTLYFLGRAA